MTNLTILFSRRLTRLEEQNIYQSVYIVLEFLSASNVYQRRDVLFFPLFKHFLSLGG